MMSSMRSIWQQTGDANAALKRLGHRSSNERHLLHGLSKKHQNDLVGALNFVRLSLIETQAKLKPTQNQKVQIMCDSQIPCFDLVRKLGLLPFFGHTDCSLWQVSDRKNRKIKKM